jgi:hypothetical protein
MAIQKQTILKWNSMNNSYSSLNATLDNIYDHHCILNDKV